MDTLFSNNSINNKTWATCQPQATLFQAPISILTLLCTTILLKIITNCPLLLNLTHQATPKTKFKNQINPLAKSNFLKLRMFNNKLKGISVCQPHTTWTTQCKQIITCNKLFTIRSPPKLINKSSKFRISICSSNNR